MKKYVYEDQLVNYVSKEELDAEIPNIVQEVINALTVWDGGEY